MKIRHTASTGCIMGQFVVEAETDSERILLQMFCAFPRESRREYQFHLHGETFSSDKAGATSFNFGYTETKSKARACLDARGAMLPNLEINISDNEGRLRDLDSVTAQLQKAYDGFSTHSMSDHALFLHGAKEMLREVITYLNQV